MLDSVKIQRRQSEIRQALAELVGKDNPSEDETRSMNDLDAEFRTNETRYRAALTVEDVERREAGDELETRSDREFAEMVSGFELRQVALFHDEGKPLSGQTAEVVQELRSQGGYTGIPVPYMALEQRAGETIAADVPNPVRTLPIIDRLFPESVAGRMGAQVVTIDHGEVEYPVVTSNVTVGWAPTELGEVPGPFKFTTAPRSMRPDYNLGVQMQVSRRAMKQTGAALEQAIRRDMSGAIRSEMDRVVFQGSGTNGQPLGVIAGAATYGITDTAEAGADWAAFRSAITRFMVGNVAGSASEVRMMIRPEVWDALDGDLVAGTAQSQWDRLVKNLNAQNIAISANALPEPAGTERATSALLTTRAGGVPPIFVGLWGAVDVIRDPYTEAASGQLKLTALATMDVTVARPSQLQLVSGFELGAAA